MPAGRTAAKKGSAAAAVENMFQLAVLCQRPVLKMPAGRAAAKKEKRRRLPLKTCFGWRFFVKRPVLKMPAGRTAAKKGSTGDSR